MKNFLSLALASAAAVAPLALAQNATTTPVGAMTYSFPATTAISTTSFSVPLIASPVYSGKISSLTSASITVTGAAWTSGAYSTAALPYFVRFTSGAQAGRMIKITVNTADTLTLDTLDDSTQTTPLDLAGFSVVAWAGGDSFEIVPGDTIATLFGDNTGPNPLVFVGGTSLFNADSVSVYNKATSMWVPYFFNTASGAWRQRGDNVSIFNNSVIYPESGILITRRASRPATSITVFGVVPNQVPMTKNAGQISTVFTSTRFPVDITLAQLSLSNWTKGTSLFNADAISVYNVAQAKWDAYFQSSSNNMWRLRGDNVIDRSNFVIPAGTTIGITKRAPVSGSASLFKVASLPYAL